MPALNRRRELFCQAVASGESLRKSACSAGYSRLRAQQTGSELGKIREVSVRVCELRAAIAKAVTETTNYSAVEAMAEADEALRMAMAKGNASHAVAAIALKARLAGLLIERRQIDYRDVSELSDAELESLIEGAESTDTDGLTH